MARLVKSPAVVSLLTASGASYSLTINDLKVPPIVGLLTGSGLSYKVSIHPENSYSIATLTASGSSYKVTIPVIKGGFVTPPVILTPVAYSTSVSYNIRELLTDSLEFSFSYRDLPPADVQFSFTYPSGYRGIEKLNKALEFPSGSIHPVENLDVDYHYVTGVDLVERNLKKTFSFTYVDRLKATASVSFDVRKRLVSSNAISYTSNVRIIASTSASYTSISALKVSLPLSYSIIATVYRLLVSTYASYNVNASRLTKSKGISFTNFESLSKEIATAYSINCNRLIRNVSVSFNSLDRIVKSTTASYDVNSSRVIKSTPISFTNFERITYPTTLSFSLGIVPIRKVSQISYQSFEPIKATYSVSYNVRQSLLATASISYSKPVNIRKSTSVSYNSPIRLVTPFETGYTIRDFDRLLKSTPITYFSVKEITTVVNTPNSTLTLPDGTKIPSGNTIYQSQNIDVIEVEPLLVIGGEIIYVLDMSVAVDEGNYTYSCDATLANYMDLIKFESNKPFYVVLQGETYSFVVDSRTLNREEVNAPQAKIRGLSPTSHFTSPRSKQIIGTTFSESYTAKQIADHLLYDSKINYTIGDSGNDLTQDQANAIGLNWEIQDWGIPPYRYGAENTYPLDALKTIVEAVGGVVEATPEGNIRARYKFPVRVPDYSDATTDHFFYDADDIISIQENHAPNRMVNAVYVKTYQDMGIQDTIEYFDQLSAPDPWGTVDTFGGGIVRVFPAIWRDTVDLSHNRNDDPDVYLEYQGVEDWTPNEWVNPEYGWETIDIVKGQGSTKYPITKVLGYGYMSDNAGEIIINDYSRTFYTKSEAVRFSIVKLKYQTRCHRWKLVAKGGTHIQFKIADTVFNTYLR